MSSIKIFVSSRIDQQSYVPANPYYVPVLCGAVYNKNRTDILRDDTGDNISSRRMSFCELTVQYWAWKNQDADYMGLCHFRRFLNFTTRKFIEGASKQVVIPALNDITAAEYGLIDQEQMEKYISSYDAVVLQDCPVAQMPTPAGYPATVQELWDKQIGAIVLPGAVKALMESIKEKAPDIYKYAEEYMKSGYFRGYNCFVMKRELFHKFCEFEFSVLFDVEKKIDSLYEGNYSQRTCGYLGEILFSIFIYYLQKQNYKVKETQLLVFMESVAPQQKPLDPNIFNIVSVIRPEDLTSAVILTESLSRSAQDGNYCLTFLCHGLLPHTKKEILEACKSPNIIVDFFDPTPLLYSWSLDLGNISCFLWPLLSPWLFYGSDKILMLSANAIFLQEPLSLNEIDLKSKLLAAVVDINTQTELCNPQSNVSKFLNQLELDNKFLYYDDSVLLLHLSQCRERLSFTSIVNLLQGPTFCRFTKDYWNLIVNGPDVIYLNHEWNIRPNASDVSPEVNWYTPLVENRKRDIALESPAIMVCWDWRNPNSPMAKIFWQIARNTSVYERLIYEMRITTYNQTPTLVPSAPYQSRIRKLSDKILPKGSRRREFCKKLLPKGSKRWNFCKKVYYKIFKK